MTVDTDMNISPILGTNAPNYLQGTGRSEVISGAGGDDRIFALSGNDEVFGGSGNDLLYGQGGDDTIYGSGKPSFIDMGNLVIGEEVEAKVTFMNEGAGYRNALGVYEINNDGSISNVQILFANASKQGSGGDLIPGQSAISFGVPEGAQLGFFIVSNGYGKGAANREALEASSGTYEFRTPEGGIGSINDPAIELWWIDAQGNNEVHVQSQFGYDIFHSVASAANDYAPNPDEYMHVVGRANTVTGELLIGFEDIRGGGDNDYDDTIITVDLGRQNIIDQLPEPTASDGTVEDDDLIYGGDGNDTLYGISGDDMIAGGEGNDILHGNSGHDKLYGNAGNDELSGESGNDELFGGSGNDILQGNSGDDILYGNSGEDSLTGNSGNDFIYGGGDADRLQGGSGDDELNGDGGEDHLSGGSGRDLLNGGSNDDYLEGGSGDDTLFGEGGNDKLDGQSGNDKMSGGDGADVLNGHSGDDKIYGDGGQDKLIGGGGNDTLNGGDHNDKLYGGSGRDMLVGGNGNDYLTAGSGDDFIIGGAGNDKMRGGDGADTFVFDAGLPIENDRIFDWDELDVMLITGLDEANFEYVESIMREEDSSVVFYLSDSDTISVRDTTISDFSASDFLFT